MIEQLSTSSSAAKYNRLLAGMGFLELMIKLRYGVTATVKTHGVWQHVLEFIEKRGTALGIWSEQAGEAAHSDWKPHWKRYAVNLDHEDYPGQLEKAGNSYNASHI